MWHKALCRYPSNEVLPEPQLGCIGKVHILYVDWIIEWLNDWMIIDYYSQSAYVDWMIEWTAVCICHSDPSEHRKKVCVVFDIM